MDFVTVCATVEDVLIEDIGVLVLRGKSTTISGALIQSKDLWDLIQERKLFQILTHLSKPIKPEPEVGLEEVTVEELEVTERKLDAVLDQLKAPKLPNALRKLPENPESTTPKVEPATPFANPSKRTGRKKR
jgi:hypothetical protein